MSDAVERRNFLKRCIAVPAGAVVGLSLEEKILLARGGKKREASDAFETKPGSLPCGKLGKTPISRLILGGNLVGGVAHSRDLVYVSRLVSRYFTDEKIMETWQLAEECGINTMSAWPSRRMLSVYKRYRHERGGRIQWIGHTSPKREALKTCIDNGAAGIYTAGDPTESAVRDGKLEILGEAMHFIRQNGLFCGVACHSIKVPQAMDKAGITVDFTMKTLHHGKYWSATPREERTVGVRVWDPTFDGKNDTSGHYHDNIWCLDPEGTVEYMKSRKTPWMAFKILAAGAIHPREGFRYAFEHGADFIHVGMFDFQVRENAILAKKILSGTLTRERPWRA